MKKPEFSVFNFIMLFFAGVINAVGVTLLLAPVNLYDSGVSGLSMLVSGLTPDWLQLWMVLLIINLPIYLFGLKKQGVEFTVYSIFAICIYSLSSLVFQTVIPTFAPDFFANGSPIAGTEMILCSVFGGMLSGVGSGLTIRYGGSMDGMETLGVIFAKNLNLSIGNFVMIFNVILYLTTGIINTSFVLPLFSIVAYVINGAAVDFITEGLDQAKGALIITEHYDVLAPVLSEEFGRGLTVMDAKGYYSNSHKKIIYCVINRFQLARLRSLIHKHDENAFVTVMDISDVLGMSVKGNFSLDLGSKKKKPRTKKAVEITPQTQNEKEDNNENV